MNHPDAHKIWDYLQGKVDTMNREWPNLSLDLVIKNQEKVKMCHEIQREIERLFPDDKFGKT